MNQLSLKLFLKQNRFSSALWVDVKYVQVALNNAVIGVTLFFIISFHFNLFC